MSKVTVIEKTYETGQLSNLGVSQLCEEALRFERAGEYESARESLAHLWSGIGTRPRTDGLPEATSAEVLLRVGALSGWLGSAGQISGAQEFAKDLLGESIRIFESLGDDDKVSEAQTDLAICYWREGAFEEGRVYFREARQRAKSATNQLRALVNNTIVEISSGSYHEALNLLDEAAPLLQSVSDESSHGRFHMQRGLVFKKLGGPENLDRALIEDTAASFHFERAGHRRYVARIENNIGFILLQLNRPADAIGHLDRARSLFLQLKDTGSVAQVNETRARVLMVQQRYAHAETAATAAVSALEQGGERSLLAEALMTQGAAFARLGKNNNAHSSFQRAARVSELAGDLLSAGHARLMHIEQLHEFLSPTQSAQLFLEADQCLQANVSGETLSRLRSCMRIIAAGRASESESAAETGKGSLEEQMLTIEANLIKQALDGQKGSITRAAQTLGLTHQGLAYILNNRHSTLR